MSIDLPIIITAKAIEEIKKIMDTKNIPAEYSLRIGTKGGGCSGVSFLLGFDKPLPDDKRYQVKGINVLISKKHMMHVAGMELDFHEGTEAKGFLFHDPSEPASNKA